MSPPLYLKGNNPGTQWVRGWLGPREGLEWSLPEFIIRYPTPSRPPEQLTQWRGVSPASGALHLTSSFSSRRGPTTLTDVQCEVTQALIYPTAAHELYSWSSTSDRLKSNLSHFTSLPPLMQRFLPPAAATTLLQAKKPVTESESC
jgi:hypothetical protein